MEKKAGSVEFELSPLRSLDDFILDSARFQIPNIKDLDKWGKRVHNNLLYYQTNYFLMIIVWFLISSYIHPTEMLCGSIAMGVAFGVFYYVTNAQPAATQFKKDHPLIGILFILGAIYFLLYMLGSVIVWITGIVIPVAAMFLHASMRLRNMRNKITNKIDSLTMRRTPMSIFLESLDCWCMNHL